MRRALLLPLLLALAGCGAGDSSGPRLASVGGIWRLSYGSMAGSLAGVPVSCMSTLDFAITQSGATFSGAQSGAGTIICTSAGQTILDEPVGGESIEDGQVNGNSITFHLGSIAGQHSALVAGGSMSGSAEWIFDLGTATDTLNGHFTGMLQGPVPAL